MALFLSGVEGEIRGSAGGTTYARNRFGQYFRQRSVPVNPKTSRQNAIRGHMTAASTSWRDTLTDTQRAQWDLYAENTPWLNKLGQSVSLTGQMFYIRQYVAASLYSRTPVAAGPGTFGVPDPPELWTPTISVAADNVSIAFTATLNTDDLDWLFFMGQPKSPSITFFDGPWRFLGAIEGDSTTPPSSPETFDLQWPVAVDQKVWIYGRALDPEGRLSAKFRQDVAVVA